MNDFWNYAWLIAALWEKDHEIEARIVTLNGVVFLVAARQLEAAVLPLEGEHRGETDGGLKTFGQFSLNAESDEARKKFIEGVLSKIASPAADRHIVHLRWSPFNIFGGGDDD